MGYASYTLPDGREAGYAVKAECDAAGCTNEVYRGMDQLCGSTPDGHRDPSEPGCGKYFCTQAASHHDCPNPACGAYSADGNLYCQRARGHELPHRDAWSEETFTEIESQEESIVVKELGGDVVSVLPGGTESFTVTVQVPVAPVEDTWERLFPGVPRPAQPRYQLAVAPEGGGESVSYGGIFVPADGGVEFREDPAPTDREPVVLFIAYPPITTDKES